MKKRQFTALLCILLLFLTAPSSTAAAANTVWVTLPDFAVTLNGQTLSNDYSKYPFLVYSGITYFPMTYYDCRLLGLRTTWSATDGLGIEKSDEPVSEYAREVQTVRNKRNQTARIAGGKITVNGKSVNNSREQYPLLEFREVTYFPLTWRFAVEEFGWDYRFDTDNGLTVSNPAAAFASTDPWEGSMDGYAAIPGVAGQLGCLFYAPEKSLYSSPGPAPYLSLYNVAGEEVSILSSDFQWEYQVRWVSGGADELVYRKAIPFYSGNLPAGSFVQQIIDDSYDYSHAPKGDYRAVLVHPDSLSYQCNGVTHSEATENGGYAIKFSRDFTVR